MDDQKLIFADSSLTLRLEEERIILKFNAKSGPQGPQGVPGVASWSSSTAYHTGDVVLYDGVFYVALTDNTDLEPDTHGSDWDPLAGAGSVTDVSVVETSTVSGTVANSHTTPALSLTAKHQKSIVADSDGLELDGDVIAPGNNKVYGTNSSGTKGWKSDPAGGVTSVNGHSGAVTLGPSDVGADSAGAASTAQTNAETYADTQIAAIDFPVDSVNGQTDTVVLDSTDVGAFPLAALFNNEDLATIESGIPAGISRAGLAADPAFTAAFDALGAAATAQTNAETYADDKVEDAINDGTTTKAPSENAVFDALALKQSLSGKGAANGYAPLDASSKIPSAYLPSSAMEFKGTYNATTNSPSLANGTGDAGDYYIVNVAGTHDFGAGPLTLSVGDALVYDGSAYDRVGRTDLVSSVFGRTGVIAAVLGDYAASLVTNDSSVSGSTVKDALNTLYTTLTNIDWKPSVRLAAIVALPANTYANGTSGVGATITMTATGVLAVDTTTVNLGDRILVMAESTTTHNGVYVCTTAGAVGVAAVLTRATDFNQGSQFVGAVVYVRSGTGSGPLQREYGFQGSGVPTVGSSAITFAQTNIYDASGGVTLTGHTFSANLSQVMGTLNPTAIKTVANSPVGPSASDYVLVDTSSGAVTITLPISITPAKTMIAVQLVAGTNPVTINTSSGAFFKAGGPTSITLSTLYQEILFFYNSSVWYVVGSNYDIGQLDLRYQGLDSDLTTIAGLTATTDNFMVAVSSAWASRTPSQVKTTLALDQVTNTSDVNKPVSTAQQTALNLKEDLTNKDIDGTFAANSDTRYPSQKAAKTYADTKEPAITATTTADYWGGDKIFHNFNTAVRTNRLDQMAVPTAPVAFNGQKITGIANGTASSDAAAFGQIPTSLPPNGTAGGSLAGTYPNPTIASNVSLPGSPITTTQSAGDNSTKVSTTAFVANAISTAIAGVNPAVAVQAATAAVLPNSPTYLNGVSGIGATLTTATTNTALVVDGYTPVLNDRILVKNQASAFQNGVYFLSTVAALGVAWVLTRALDYDTPSDMNSTGAIPVLSGTVNLDTQWVQSSTVNTVGTDAVTFTLFSLNPATIQKALIPTTVKTASTYTAAAQDFVPVDLTSNSVTITLPSAPADGTIVAVKTIILVAGNFTTINCGGTDVFNRTAGPTSATQSTQGQSQIFQYKSSLGVWYVLADDRPSTQRVVPITAASNIYTINRTITDVAVFGAPAANFTVAAPTGTPADGDQFFIRISSGATGYVPTWNAIFISSGIATLPSTALPINKTVTFAFKYDLAKTKWILLAMDVTGY